VLQFRNKTPFSGLIWLAPDPAGVESVYAVVKGTFSLAAGMQPAQTQMPVAVEDEYVGEPGRSSICVPSDICLVKPGTDVLLLGHAYAPAGRRITSLDVGLRAGPVQAVLRVFGDRFWERDSFGVTISPPQPFEQMPLVWERAYGGTTQDETEPRNPVGAGLSSETGARLPNLEDPRQLIGSPRDRPSPVNFAPTCAHWQPRRSYAGTYDETWQRYRAPYLPADFDPRFFQISPPYLITPNYLQGGEPVEVVGAAPSAALQFKVPQCVIRITYRLDQGKEVRAAALDTLVIEPDAARVILVWRTALACDKLPLRVREVEAQVLEAA